MTTDTRTPSQRAWAAIIEAATTPQQWALVHQASRGADTAGWTSGQDAWCDHATGAYGVMVEYGTKQELNAHKATPEHAVDLLHIRSAGRNGLTASRINGNARKVFLRRGWVTTTAPGDASDWSGVLHLTDDGYAHAMAAVNAPLRLSDASALALRAVAAAGPDGLEGFWPGPDNSLRVALQWDLVEVHDRPGHGHGKRYTLTDEGHVALAQWQARPRGNGRPTKAQAALLAELLAGRTGPNQRRLHDTGTYDRCDVEGWIRYGEPDQHGRRDVFITDAGRAAHDRYTAVPERPRPERVRVGELKAGQTVRLANRSGWRNLTADWVTLAREPEFMRVRGSGPGGYRVWITTPDGERQYTDQVFHGGSRFEIKP